MNDNERYKKLYREFERSACDRDRLERKVFRLVNRLRLTHKRMCCASEPESWKHRDLMDELVRDIIETSELYNKASNKTNKLAQRV